MGSALVGLAALATNGLLFAIDPGKAIAEIGFANFQEMDLAQQVAWGFRTTGVVVAQLIIIVLWLRLRWRPPQASPWYTGTSRPSSMPAAVVSVLHGHMTWSPTLLAAIIEMCQRGALRIEAVGTRVGFLYRLSRQGPTQHDWERTLCDSLPSRPTTIDALREELDKHSDAIGDQIGNYLQRRGLFHDNPVRVRRENSDDGSDWWLVASILTGVGSGLWAALWLDQWWANALIGLFAGLVYSFITSQMTLRTGMLKPTPAGAHEISQWLGLSEFLAGPGAPATRDQSDPMLAYAVAFDVAQPWLTDTAPAPSWFGSGDDSSLRGTELDAAYRAFLHAPEWYLSGRSGDASKAAAQWGYEEEVRLLKQLDQLDQEAPEAEQPAHAAGRETAEGTEDARSEPEPQCDSPADPAGTESAEYETYRVEGTAEQKKGGGCLSGCLTWLVSLIGIGVVVLLVLFSLDVVSPRDKPCPLDSPPILAPGPLSVVGVFNDACMKVSGTVVYQDADELLIDIDRGEYVQRVSVRGPEGVFEAISPGRGVTLAGRFKEEENGSYAIHFVPDDGSDREWWQNLRDNLEALFRLLYVR